MDDALIKPQKVRRVVRVLPAAPGSGEADVVPRGTLVEVADPRALRPRDFRADFVYGPNETVEDVAMCDLPPMLESVLSGTDATIVVGGTEGAGQGMLDGPAGLAAEAVRRLMAELQERMLRHRQGGGGGYTFQTKMQCMQIVGDRVEDLFTDIPELVRMEDKVNGVAVSGLRSLPIVGHKEAIEAIEVAQRRRDPSRRAQSAIAVTLEVTQADYWAGWGLFGRMVLLELPALDCLAEDKGLVQLREGFDTFRGLYHLRNVVKVWQPLQPNQDVSTTSLTWLLRDVLCGGSVSATFILTLQQKQSAASLAILEFIDDLTKLETNPVCCDHRVAGFARALRADCLTLRQALQAARAGQGLNNEGLDDARRIILELEKRLHNAERVRYDATRAQDTHQGKAIESQDKYVSAIRNQEQMHEQLVISETDRLKACHGLVEMQLQNTEIRDEMSEMQYKDNMLLVLLENDVAELQTEMREKKQNASELATVNEDVQGRLADVTHVAGNTEEEMAKFEMAARSEASELLIARRKAEQLQQSLDAATDAKASTEVAREVERAKMQNQLDTLKNELQSESLGHGRKYDESEAHFEEIHRELRTEARVASERGIQLDLAKEAERKAVQGQESTTSEMANCRTEFQQSLTDLGKAGADGDETLTKLANVAGMSSSKESELHSELYTMRAHIRELQDQLAFSSQAALGWAPASAEADKARLRTAIPDAAKKAEALVRDRGEKDLDFEKQIRSLQAELDAEKNQSAVTHADLGRQLQQAHAESTKERQQREAEHSKEIQRRDAEAARRDAELRELRDVRQKQADSSQVKGIAANPAREAELVEKICVLQNRLDKLQDQTPESQRAQLQRLAYLEKHSRTLEAERSELLVRATVAEEQLVELQRHLKEMTKNYQMEILNLKMAANKGH